MAYSLAHNVHSPSALKRSLTLGVALHGLFGLRIFAKHKEDKSKEKEEEYRGLRLSLKVDIGLIIKDNY